MSAGLITTDTDGRITFANEAAEHLLGTSLVDVRGRALDELLGWSESCSRSPAGRSASSARRSWDREECRSTSRARRWRTKRGVELGRLFLVDDVTDLRALEGEVQLKDRMAAIGEMAAGIAHEIRNPLASISGSVQMLQRSLELDGDRARLMNIVLKESNRLDDTIGEFLEFARPREARRARVDLGELARETVTLLQNSEEVLRAPRHSRRTERSWASRSRSTPISFGRSSWNLCKNAIKAMPKGGTMTVDVTQVWRMTSCCPSRTPAIGMSGETRARAFQPLVGRLPRGDGLGPGNRLPDRQGSWGPRRDRR